MGLNTLFSLPDEIWSGAIGYLTLCDLVSTSLVSRSWNTLTFAPLHYTVYLSGALRLKQFAERAISNKKLASAIRGLVLDEERLDDEDGDYFTENDLEHLIAILRATSHLTHFSWEMRFIPENPEVMRLLQDDCPNLRSFHFTMHDPYDGFFEDHYLSIFNFKHLHHFSLNIMEIPVDFNDDHLGPIVSLIQSCHGLKSLTISVQVDGGAEDQWSPRALFEQVGDITLPSLHTFNALGVIEIDSSFFESPDSDALRQFFARHPTLHTIGLGWTREYEYWGEVDPEQMARLFPSLVNFEAPCFLCLPVMTSSLAAQLKSVTVLDVYFNDQLPSVEVLGSKLTSLPELERFDLFVDKDRGVPDEPVKFPLKEIVRASPRLKELEFAMKLGTPKALVELLEMLPELRVLAVRSEAFGPLQQGIGASDWKECVASVVNTCPLLRTIRILSHSQPNCWEIKRGEGDAVTLIGPRNM